MNNQEILNALIVPEFIADIRVMFKPNKDNRGIYIFPQVIEDMFTVFGIHEQFEKFY